MWVAAQEFPACQSNLWDRITGWEVVIAVLLIMAAWTAVQTARMYFMWRVAQTSRCGCVCHERDI